MDALEKTPNAIFFAGATIRRDFEGNIWNAPLYSWRDGVYYPPEGFLEMLKKGHPEWTGIIFRKKVLSKIGIIDVGVGLASDFDFELRIAAKYAIVISRKPCAVFFSHSSSASSQGLLNSSWPGWLKMIENIANIKELSEKVRREACQQLRKRLRDRVFIAGTRAAIIGLKEDASQASDILRNYFDNSFQSSFLRMLASDSLNGRFLRSLLRSATFVRRVCRKKIIPAYWQIKYRFLKDL